MNKLNRQTLQQTKKEALRNVTEKISHATLRHKIVTIKILQKKMTQFCDNKKFTKKNDAIL